MHNKKQYLPICFRSESFLIYTFVQLICFLCDLAPWWLNWYVKNYTLIFDENYIDHCWL